jgi:hypothetical protein
VPVPSANDVFLIGLSLRRLRVAARDVVFVKGVIDASEGLAVVFADAGGDLTIAAPPSQEKLLDELLTDLADEVGALFEIA